MNLKYGIVICLVTSATACFDDQKSAVKNVSYYKDMRTGICFASGTFGWGDHVSSTFSYVPCDKVPSHLLEEVK